LAILAAGVAGWIWGAIWYGVLSKPYQRALGLNPDDCKDKKMPILPKVAAFVAALVMSGMHREAVAWLCRSVIQIPPGATVGVDVTSLASAVVTQAIGSAALAVRMAFPILVAVFFGHVSLGVIGRTAPQLNINSVGFSITILAGGGALYLLAPPIAQLAARTAASAFTGGR